MTVWYDQQGKGFVRGNFVLPFTDGILSWGFVRRLCLGDYVQGDFVLYSYAVLRYVIYRLRLWAPTSASRAVSAKLSFLLHIWTTTKDSFTQTRPEKQDQDQDHFVGLDESKWNGIAFLQLRFDTLKDFNLAMASRRAGRP